MILLNQEINQFINITALMKNVKEGMLFLAKVAHQCLTNRVLSVKALSTFIDAYFPNM